MSKVKNAPDTLMNFRIPKELKEEFQEKCIQRRTTMTAEIVRYILDFVGNVPSKSDDKVWKSSYKK